jgi:hypothetical protein
MSQTSQNEALRTGALILLQCGYAPGEIAVRQAAARQLPGLQGGANLLRRLGFTPEEIALRQAAAVAALPPPVVRKIRRPILIPRERMSHPDLAGLTGKTYNIAYNRKMRRLSKERRLAEMPPRPPIPPGGVNSKHPELHGVQRHRYKTEFRRMQSRKFIAAGLRCDGGPRKSKHRPELAGLKGAAYRRAYQKIYRAEQKAVQP